MYKAIRLKVEIWERLRNASYDNRMGIPAFLKLLMDNYDKNLKDSK